MLRKDLGDGKKWPQPLLCRHTKVSNREYIIQDRVDCKGEALTTDEPPKEYLDNIQFCE